MMAVLKEGCNLERFVKQVKEWLIVTIWVLISYVESVSCCYFWDFLRFTVRNRMSLVMCSCRRTKLRNARHRATGCHQVVHLWSGTSWLISVSVHLATRLPTLLLITSAMPCWYEAVTVFPLIEAGSQIQAESLIRARGQTSFVLIEAGSLIQAGSLTEAGESKRRKS